VPRSALYDRDFYAWANEQATLLREGKLEQADLESIAEEIESMGKTEKRELISQLTVLLLQLLKWRFKGYCGATAGETASGSSGERSPPILPTTRA
jgi:hypothetical protein